MTRLLLGLAFLAGVVAGCTGLAALEGRAQSAEVVAAIETAAARYGVAPRFLYCLSWHEARWRPLAYNRAGYHGLFQFDGPTFALGSRLAGLTTSSPYDPWSASEAAAALIAAGQVGRWPPARFCGRWWA